MPCLPVGPRIEISKKFETSARRARGHTGMQPNALCDCKGPKLTKNAKIKMKENVFFVLVFSPSYQDCAPEHNNETPKSLRHRVNCDN